MIAYFITWFYLNDNHTDVRQQVDSALEQVEEAINWLAEEATEDSDFESVAPALSVYWTELRVLYSVITRTLGELGHEVAHLDFAMAAPLLPTLDGAVARYESLSCVCCWR